MKEKNAVCILLGHSIQLKIVTYSVNVKNLTLPLLYQNSCLNAILVTKMQLPMSKTPNGCKLTRQFSEVVLFRKSIKPLGRLC